MKNGVPCSIVFGGVYWDVACRQWDNNGHTKCRLAAPTCIEKVMEMSKEQSALQALKEASLSLYTWATRLNSRGILSCFTPIRGSLVYLMSRFSWEGILLECVAFIQNDLVPNDKQIFVVIAIYWWWSLEILFISCFSCSIDVERGFAGIHAFISVKKKRVAIKTFHS